MVPPRPFEELRPLTTAPSEAVSPAWSPDGKLIAYVEGGNPADMYYAVNHLSVVPVQGGECRPLTRDLDRNPMRPRFSPDGRSVLFLLEDRLNIHLARVPVAGGQVERVVGGDRVISAFDMGRKGEIVVLDGFCLWLVFLKSIVQLLVS